MGDNNKTVISTLREQFNQTALLLMQISNTLAQLEGSDSNSAAPTNPQPDSVKPVLLGIDDCVKRIDGLSKYSLMKALKQNKIPYIRSSDGDKSKYLISEKDLLEYYNCR